MDNQFDNFRDEVQRLFSNCEDFICRQGGNPNERYCLMLLKGITSREYISEMLLRPLLRLDMAGFQGDFGSIIENPSLTQPKNAGHAASMIAKGEVLILAESKNGFYSVLANAELAPSRSIEEPTSDVTIRGPKAGFVEDAEKNTAMLRRYIRTPSLKFKSFTIGSVSETKVILSYVEGRADQKLIDRISTQLSSIKANVITDSTNIAMLLEGKSAPILPSCGSSEKVDKVASKLMAGRIALIVDGSPFVLTLPFLFIEGFQSAEDYLHTAYYATFIRILRVFAFISAIFAPSILCAVINYDPSIMPWQLYGIISEARKDIPLSFFWEIVMVLILFEVLREVGVRMPRTVGDAVGIVGSIILGNTAVEAGIVSSVGVITVAFSAVCAFITPAYMYIIVLARITVLFASELFGIWGLVLSALIFTFALFKKKSFGVSYMSPLFPFNRKGMEDSIFSWPKRTLGRKENLQE